MYSKDYYETAEYNPELIGMNIFQKMSQFMPYMVFITRAPDFKLLYANRKVSEFLSLNLDELRQMDGRILNMMHPEDIRILLETGQKIQFIGDAEALRVVVRLNTKDGKVVHLETAVSVYKRNADGSPAEFFCISQDVTERVELEMRAHQLELITSAAEEAFRYGAWEWFPGEDRVIWSGGIYDIFEQQEENQNFTVEKYISMIHPEDISHFNAVVEHAYANAVGFTLEYRIILPNGNICYLQELGKPVLDEKGSLVKFIGTIRDISDYWETLNSLKKYEVTLQQAEKNLQLGTWEWDISKKMVKWSDGFWQILDYPAELRNYNWQPIEKYFRHLTPEMREAVSNRVEFYDNYDGSQPLEPQEATLITYTGKPVHIITYTRVLEWKDGKPVVAVGSTVDITQMKEIQKNLESKVMELGKAYDEMEQFSYVASHDLQEPLRKISAFSERLKTKCGEGLDADCALYLDRILDGTNRMRVLIENLLTLSRTKRNTDFFKSTDLNEILEEVLSDLENKIVAESAEVHHTQLPVIEAIPTQMHQLLLNLISNSLKFTQKDINPVIHINSERLSQQQKDEYNLDTRLDYILIHVQDNGIGFESGYAETIFAPFKRLHGRSEYEGTGIGLAICKKVAKNHSGAIWATSTPGNGAAFHVVLAVNQPKA